MSTSTEPRPPAARDLPDLDAEREVDLRRYWDALLLRWWLPAAGLVGGIVIGLLVSIGGSQVYTAKATIYVGQPLSSGGAQVQSQATNPSTVHQIVTAESTIDAVARRIGLKRNQLRGHVSTQAVSGAITRLGQNSLYSIKVTGHLPGKVAAAANGLAQAAVQSRALGHYTETLITNLEGLVKSEKESLASIDSNTKTLQTALQNGGLSTTDRLILLGQLNGLVQQRLSIVDQLSTNQQQLALAQDVEAPQLITRAVALKTTARSRRNTVIVAALIGLLLGIVAALLWEPVGRVVRRDS
jgi:Chain length determinant protein